ncbi:hypothetical protein D3C76_1047600 [compost metagenome]
MGLAGHGDLPLLHGFEQRRLDLGRRTVDLVGEDHIAEQRTGLELDAVLPIHLLQDFPAGDVRGQQVRGELDATHARVEVPGQGLDGTGLGQARQAFEKEVAVGQKAKQHVADGLLLAEYRVPDLLLQGDNLLSCGHCVFPAMAVVS